MPRETFFPNPANKPSGFSPITKSGNLLFVSGQVPINSKGDLGLEIAIIFPDKISFRIYRYLT
jgi:enamine deaminase RidA (YjgF/YER057c/UK114 family)